MSKMGSHDPFAYLEHKLWPKERQEIKLAIWFVTIKSQESPQFPCVQVACHIFSKDLDESYNFASDFTSIEGLHTKLWASKVTRALILGISRLSFGSLGTKWHLGASPVTKQWKYYKGEGGGFPKFKLCWVLWIRVYPWLVRTSKVFQLRNQSY